MRDKCRTCVYRNDGVTMTEEPCSICAENERAGDGVSDSHYRDKFAEYACSEGDRREKCEGSAVDCQHLKEERCTFEHDCEFKEEILRAAGDKLKELGRREYHFSIVHVACDMWRAIAGTDGTLFPEAAHEEKEFKTFEEAVDYLWGKLVEAEKIAIKAKG